MNWKTKFRIWVTIVALAVIALLAGAFTGEVGFIVVSLLLGLAAAPFADWVA